MMNEYERAVAMKKDFSRALQAKKDALKKEITDLRLPIENMHCGINWNSPIPKCNQTIGESFLQSAVVRICYLLEDVIDLIDCDQKPNETKEA